MIETQNVLQDVLAERLRQYTRYGVQTLRDVPDYDLGVLDVVLAQEQCDNATIDGCVTWGHILVEEVAEVLAEATRYQQNREALRAELIQVAAVAVQWVEAIDKGNRNANTSLGL